jgi:uncharacterized membrane protein YbhN (UPF0104 family)
MLRRILSWSITVALLAYILWFLLDHRAIFSERFSGTLWHAALLALGVGATWVINSLQTLLPLRELGVRVGFWENLLLTIAVVFGNYLPMRAGSLMRMEYIRSVHGLGYLRYGGLLGARSLMLLWVAGGLGLAGALGMALAGRQVHGEVFLIFGSVLATGVLPFILPLHHMLPRSEMARRLASQLTESLELIRQNRRMTRLYLGLVALQLAILTARLAVAFDVIERHPPLWAYCFLSPMATILSFINITPGNLGLREWTVGLLSASVGMDYAEGIFAASVDRAVLMFMTFSIGGAAAMFVMARLGPRRADAASS